MLRNSDVALVDSFDDGPEGVAALARDAEVGVDGKAASVAVESLRLRKEPTVRQSAPCCHALSVRRG